ncbi:ABC transporter ATP-binding protein [Demequina sp.]|uniref:ABC transporter ATP-binding protein n=1 Tax=Demequina sp. TaxID=2050685 RepID=UPI003D14994D
MTAVIEVQGLTRHYGKVKAVQDATFRVEEGAICGLLGRNGAGKTTLMRLITGQEFASTGTIRVFGENPVENASVLARTCFVRESQVYPDSFRGKHVLRAAAHLFPNWDGAYAARLAEEFRVPLDRRMKKMSRGQRSAVGVIVGLASRAELTLLDEPYAGLDAVARQLFYDHLLADYSENPRTIILSTHLIDEASKLLSHVLVVDGGELLINADADDLRGTAVTLVGGHAAVEAFAQGREVLGWDSVGGISSVTLTGLSEADKARAVGSGLEVAPVSLQQLIVSRTRGTIQPEEARS